MGILNWFLVGNVPQMNEDLLLPLEGRAMHGSSGLVIDQGKGKWQNAGGASLEVFEQSMQADGCEADGYTVYTTYI